MFKVGDKVRRKEACLTSNNWPHGQKEMIVKDVSDNYLGTFEGDTHVEPFWDLNYFELVEEPVVPAVPGIPDGYRLVRIGTIVSGESFVDNDGTVRTVANSGYSFKNYVIVEPIEPVKPKTKKVKLKQYMTRLDGTGWGMCSHREASPGPSWVEVPGSEIEVEVPDEC